MEDVSDRMLEGAAGHGGTPAEPSPSSIAPGQVFAFRTRPFTEFAPAETKRFAALKILGVTDSHVAVAVLEGTWADAPPAEEIQAASVINEHRFAYAGSPAIFGVVHEWWKPERDLDAFSFVGTLPVSELEQSHVEAIAGSVPGVKFSGLHAVNHAAEGEWRWANDRDALMIEIEAEDAKTQAQRATKDERYRNRLSKLTWEQLHLEVPFERWSTSPPFPPPEFTAAARTTIKSACKALEALGPKPPREDVRIILKMTVLWFNEADEKAGGVIETEEREDIWAVLEEMAHVARQKALIDEIDQWRTW